MSCSDLPRSKYFLIKINSPHVIAQLNSRPTLTSLLNSTVTYPHSLSHSLAHNSLTHLFTHSPIRVLSHTLTPSLARLLAHPQTLSYSLMDQLMHSNICTHSTQPLIHPPSIRPSVRPSVRPYVHPSIHPSILLSIHSSIHPFFLLPYIVHSILSSFILSIPPCFLSSSFLSSSTISFHLFFISSFLPTSSFSSLVSEVHELARTMDALMQKLNESEHALKDLQDQRMAMEKDVAIKINSLFIDRRKCMGHRTRYPTRMQLLGYQ